MNLALPQGPKPSEGGNNKSEIPKQGRRKAAGKKTVSTKETCPLETTRARLSNGGQATVVPQKYIEARVPLLPAIESFEQIMAPIADSLAKSKKAKSFVDIDLSSWFDKNLGQSFLQASNSSSKRVPGNILQFIEHLDNNYLSSEPLTVSRLFAHIAKKYPDYKLAVEQEDTYLSQYLYQKISEMRKKYLSYAVHPGIFSQRMRQIRNNAQVNELSPIKASGKKINYRQKNLQKLESKQKLSFNYAFKLLNQVVNAAPETLDINLNPVFKNILSPWLDNKSLSFDQKLASRAIDKIYSSFDHSNPVFLTKAMFALAVSYPDFPVQINKNESQKLKDLVLEKYQEMNQERRFEESEKEYIKLNSFLRKIGKSDFNDAAEGKELVRENLESLIETAKSFSTRSFDISPAIFRLFKDPLTRSHVLPCLITNLQTAPFIVVSALIGLAKRNPDYQVNYLGVTKGTALSSYVNDLLVTLSQDYQDYGLRFTDLEFLLSKADPTTDSGRFKAEREPSNSKKPGGKSKSGRSAKVQKAKAPKAKARKPAGDEEEVQAKAEAAKQVETAQKAQKAQELTEQARIKKISPNSETLQELFKIHSQEDALTIFAKSELENIKEKPAQVLRSFIRLAELYPEVILEFNQNGYKESFTFYELVDSLNKLAAPVANGIHLNSVAGTSKDDLSGLEPKQLSEFKGLLKTKQLKKAREFKKREISLLEIKKRLEQANKDLRYFTIKEDLTELDLSGVDFTGSVLDNIALNNVHGSNFSRVNFKGVNAAGTDLSKADFNGVYFIYGTRGNDFTNANLNNVKNINTVAGLGPVMLHGSSMQNVDLSNRSFVNSKIRTNDFSGANLSAAYFLKSAVRAFVNMDGFIFKQADLSGTKFEGLDLRKADFTGAKLDNAIFDKCTLSQELSEQLRVSPGVQLVNCEENT